MKKNSFYTLFAIFVLVLSSCSSDCSKIVFKDGVSTLNGKLYTGDCESRWINKQLKSSQHYVDGKDDGEWLFYYIDGTIQTKAYFKEGVRIGKWEYFYENGMPWKVQTYDSLGNKTGKWKTFSEKGELIKTEIID
ncbi:hypothetical protein OAU12_03350 [Flavobacteriaceae bacterium]|nr:hypothetical protein [Flavobacteriaceae bacterium]